MAARVQYASVGTGSEHRSRVGGLALPGRTLVLLTLALAVCAQFVDWNSLFVNGLNGTLNDQVGYVTAARNWADKGSLDSSVILPSVLLQHTRRNTLYMPGHYWTLGITFRYLGYSLPHAFLPELLAFAIAVLLVYRIASALFGREVAYYSSALFIFFPLNLVYSFTAMMEMEAVAATLAALAIFLALPERMRPWLGPVTLTVPILFRETGVAVAALMALVIFCGSQQRWKRTLTFAVLTCAVVLIMLTLPIASGRPSLWTASVFYRGQFEATYADAFATAGLHIGPIQWVIAIARMIRGNLHELLIPHFAIGVPSLLDFFSMLFVLSGIPIGLFLWRRERSGFALGVAAMVLLMLLMELGFYKIWGYYGTRVILICQPFVAVLIALLLDRYLKRIRTGRLIAVATVTIVAIIATGSTYQVFRNEARINAEAAADTSFLESLGHDTRGLLVSPYEVSLPYVQKHYPARWSFVPANLRTLKILDEKYSVTTLLLPLGNSAPGSLQISDVTSIGLSEEKVITYRGMAFRVFKRTGVNGEAVGSERVLERNGHRGF
jgi:dolichyl-phosphate-mannose-protein mannosyltransferase